MSRAIIPLLKPPRARWGQYWNPRTGAFVWGCVGPECQVQTSTLDGTAGAYWSGGECYGSACPPERGLGSDAVWRGGECYGSACPPHGGMGSDSMVWKAAPWAVGALLLVVLARSFKEIGARA